MSVSLKISGIGRVLRCGWGEVWVWWNLGLGFFCVGMVLGGGGFDFVGGV